MLDAGRFVLVQIERLLVQEKMANCFTASLYEFLNLRRAVRMYSLGRPINATVTITFLVITVCYTAKVSYCLRYETGEGCRYI